MTLLIHQMALEAERTLLAAQAERGRRVEETVGGGRRPVRRLAARAGRATGVLLVRAGRHLQDAPQIEAALGWDGVGAWSPQAGAVSPQPSVVGLPDGTCPRR